MHMGRCGWLAFAFALFSCSTLPESPETHVVAFGALRLDGLLTDQEIQSALIVQTDTPGGQMEIPVSGGFFFTDPLPAGTRWRIASVSVGEEDREVGLDFSALPPGLLFLGSLEIHDGVRKVDAPAERRLLQDLLDAWRGTAWEQAIRARIREILR